MDKWVHGMMYLVLALVMMWDSKTVGIKISCSWVVVALFSAIFGGFIEILQEQFFFPRTGDWMDWLADCIGAWVGVGAWYIGHKWYERRMAQ
jgi:VanZ family protein